MISPIPTPRLILASQSPRRAELLERLGLSFSVQPADIDESARPGETAEGLAIRLAREKAMAVAWGEPGALVVGSDTIVVIDGDVLGKPADAAEAVRMITRLSGREHEVFTAVAVALGDSVESAMERVKVRFRALSPAEVQEYVGTGEPMDKAGAYGIQGFGSSIVAGITGDYFAVMGLPIVLTLELIGRHGWRYAFGSFVPMHPAGRSAGSRLPPSHQAS